MHIVPMGPTELIALGLLKVGLDHGFHQLREADARFPAQHRLFQNDMRGVVAGDDMRQAGF